MMLTSIRKSKLAKVAALVLAFEFVAQWLYPLRALALTTGPSQPEMSSFEPVGTSEMVNVFSGDFTYNIPLLDVGGYPINMAYNSGISTDQEASWVGLGWNINPGAINRSMRGLPDDFDGDVVTKRFNMKPNRTYAASVALGIEAFGYGGANLSYGIAINYNNYKGVGYEQSLNMAFTSGKGGKGPLTAGLGVTSGADGLDLTPSVSFSHKEKKDDLTYLTGTGKIGLSINSRSGMRQLSLTASCSETNYKTVPSSDKRIKTESSTRAINGGASINFASPAYTPMVSMPMVNTSLAFSAKLGTTLFGFDGTVDITGSYSSQKLERNSQNFPAYGYLNAQNGETNDGAMMDFNREKDGAFTDNTPSLPLTNFTYDIYSVNGQGIGGTYRPFRSDLGHIFDASNRTYSVSANIGAEFGVGNIAHGGVDVSITDVNTTSGRWSQDNAATTGLYFHGAVSGDPLFEPYYFKEAGEKSVDSDPGLFNAIGGDKPIRIHIEHTTGLNVEAYNEFAVNNGPNLSFPTNNFRSARQKRNQVITTMSVGEARNYGLNKNFYYGGISAAAKLHHIGEITTLRSDGSRYVFGLPAYNKLQQEVTFATQGRTVCGSTGIVTYGAGDNSIANTRGIDNYFSETETPGYAHSFLLTAVLSPDYVDYDNTPGPSEGDLGSYTRLNYVKAVNDFKWRTPTNGAYSANFNEGLKSLPEDDKGSYVYGEKEIWYVSSIETKTYIAIFSLSNRDDGLGVMNRNGAINTAASERLKKLDKITLYSKPDYNANGANATPIKVVNFEYDYSLCEGIPNSATSTGKLTLTKVYFTYGHSYKAKLSGYQFHYADLDHNGTDEVNYDYNPKANDRWGNYTPNAVTTCSTVITDQLTTSEFPYVQQDATTSKNYTAAWSMTSIDLPSGGTIEVNYEADDYAYVQDKRAGEMFKVVDFAVRPLAGPFNPATAMVNTTSITPKDLSVSIPLPSLEHYGGLEYYLYFKLKDPIPSTTPNIADKLYDEYLGNKSTEIYFRFLCDITRSSDYEFVSGYFDADANSSDNGIGIVTTNQTPGSEYQYAWIRLKTVPIGDRDNSYTQQINPICKANWQFGRLQVPRKVWEEPDPQSSDVEQIVRAIANSNMAHNILDFFKGPNRTIRDKGFGRQAMMNKSWIRLQNPDGFKYGGGARVKSVVIKDNWKKMVNPSIPADPLIDATLPSDYEAQYGQEYDYTTFDEATNRYISSGVASWEPQPGGDENPFHEPVFFNEEKKLVPDDESYIEKPYGESFFPAPGIGYSKVTVKNYIPTTGSPTVTRHGTGKTVQEFYTAKDFPTITRVGWLGVQHWKTNPIFSLLRIKMRDYLTATQGFVVELNDMHGKPKAVSVYAEGQTEALSEVKYFYKTQTGNARQLDNSVYVLKKDGSLGVGTCGLDYDFIADMREQETKVLSAGLNLNLASFLAAIIPVIVPTIIPSWSSENTRFRSASTTKVINRYGILERTEARDAGSTATTENLAWDAETGELLLTKTYTDFDDAVYNFNYPAHWSYDRMGQAYKNVGAAFNSVSVSTGTAAITNANLYFVNGDEVSVDAGNYHARAWVCSETSTDISLIDAAGLAIPTGSYTIKIIRSGRRNMQALSVGTVTSRKNPLHDNVGGDGIYDTFSFTDVDVLNASATEYAELWSVAKGKTSETQCICSVGDVGADLANMLSTLVSSGHLLTYQELLHNGTGTYSNGYTPVLHAEFPGAPGMNWQGASNLPGSSSFVATMAYIGYLHCTVSMDLPSGYAWGDVVSLSNFTVHSDSCSSSTNDFAATAVVNVLVGSVYQLIPVPVTGTTSCFTFGTCSSTTTCGVQEEDVVNPYFHNILGNWRMLRSELYLSDRTQTPPSSNNNLDIRKDGMYETRDQSTGAIIDFQPFWLANSGNDWLTSPTYWTWSQEVTKYTPFGNEVENKDALGRYSSAVFGYNNTLPVAVAANTRQQDMGFDGFEDYAFITADCREQHFNFFDAGISPDNAQAHTGLYSMKVIPSTSVVMTRQLAPTAPTHGTLNCPYVISAGDLNGVFAPYTGGGARTYVLNYWVKETTTPGTPVFNYTTPTIGIAINSSAATLTLVQKSDIIEGWQQYQYTFTVAGSATGTIEISLNNTGGSNVWFDDIRIFPFEANMTSYVYHPVNQRLTAQLDENNYATFYEYDEEGALVRVKKETERGIVTIKEARNHSYHKH